jgi:hypothetical protein
LVAIFDSFGELDFLRRGQQTSGPDFAQIDGQPVLG